MNILFADDDRNSLLTARQSLVPHYQVAFAETGREAAAVLGEMDTCAVAIVALHMASESDSSLLSEVGHRSPHTVQIILTNPDELAAALERSSQSNIFRILVRPVPPTILKAAIQAALEQYRLIASEQEILEHTLTATVRTLNDVLSGSCPEAFGRSVRIADVVDHLLKKIPISAPWRLHVAATLSQLGCVTLESDLVQKAYSGSPLTESERLRFQCHPQRAAEILSSIPHFGPVAWMIDQQLQREIPPFASEEPGIPVAEIDLGARILKLAVNFEALRTTVVSEEFVLVRLRSQQSEFSSDLIGALAGMGPRGPYKDLRRVPTAKLKPGMILNQEMRNRQGLLIVGKGQQVTLAMLFKLEGFLSAGSIDKEVMAFVDL